MLHTKFEVSILITGSGAHFLHKDSYFDPPNMNENEQILLNIRYMVISSCKTITFLRFDMGTMVYYKAKKNPNYQENKSSAELTYVALARLRWIYLSPVIYRIGNSLWFTIFILSGCF